MTIFFISCETELIVNNGSGSGVYESGDSVAIKANYPENGLRFYMWTGSVYGVKDIYSADTTFTVPLTNQKSMEITAEFVDADKKISVEVVDGSGSGPYFPGEMVTISGDKLPGDDYLFNQWEGDLSYLKNKTEVSQSFRVRLDDLYFKAIYAKKFKVSVKNGTGGGSYAVGDAVTVVANQPDQDHEFSKWIGDVSYITDETKTNQTFAMPQDDVSLEATYEEIPGKGDYDILTCDGGFLWKPIAESGGKLVVLLPSSYPSDCLVTVDGETVAMQTRANGDRPHFRYSRTGPQMCGGKECYAFVDCPNIKVAYKIPNPSARCE